MKWIDALKGISKVTSEESDKPTHAYILLEEEYGGLFNSRMKSCAVTLEEDIAKEWARSDSRRKCSKVEFIQSEQD